MLNIPDSVKALFKQDGVHKNFRAHFPNGELADITNENIVQESVKFTESVCSQDVFKFGLTEASTIEFETVGVGNMYGMTIECSCEIDCSSLSAADKADIAAGTWDGSWDGVNEVFAVPYGVFTVDSCPRNHEAMAHRKVTAYSASYSDASYNLPWFPDNMYTPKLSIDPSAFIAQISRVGLTQVNAVSATGSLPIGSLYDSNGKGYAITPVVGENRRVSPSHDNDAVSFVETDLEWNEAEYRAYGNDIADQLTALGYDLTYNAKKQKIFADNRQALENSNPMLFGPTIAVATGGSTITFLYHCKIKPGQLYPILARSRYQSSAAFCSVDSFSWTSGSPGHQRVFYYHTPRNDPRVLLDEYVNDGTMHTVETIYPSLPLPDLNPNASVKFYHYDAKSFPRIAIDSMGVSRIDSDTVNPSATTWKTRNYNVFSYVDALDKIKITNSMAELNALFGRVNRKGEAEFIRIDDSAPLAIPPGEYMSLWWDEFEVEPIGTVRYGYEADGEQVKLDYNFGEGASLYDMSDNEAFRLASGADQASIVFALITDFIPHLDPVNFVPIEFEMKGLPYLEAGDALAITAQDGTVVNSYALRIEISGVQVLQMKIESQSGLIIDSGEAAT